MLSRYGVATIAGLFLQEVDRACAILLELIDEPA